MDAEEASIYKILILATSSICGILMFSAFITVRRHAIYHRVYKKEIDHVLNKLESERARIAADIHDDLGPVLSASKINLMTITPSDEADKAQIEKSIRQIGSTSEKLREIARGLMPAVLIKKGLVHAISQFMEEFNFTNGLQIELKAEEVPPISQKASIHIYRIIQEIVHNCVKHAHASRLMIHIENSDTHLKIRTADNGIGFNEKEVRQQNTGNGLTTMQSRIELLNGRCSLQSGNGRGTRYSIEIPLGSVI